MQCVGNEVVQSSEGLLACSWRRLVGAREEVRDEPGSQARHPLMAVKGILAGLLAVRIKFIC